MTVASGYQLHGGYSGPVLKSGTKQTENIHQKREGKGVTKSRKERGCVCVCVSTRERARVYRNHRYKDV